MILLNRLAGTLNDWSEQVLTYSEKLDYKKQIRQYKNYEDFKIAVMIQTEFSHLINQDSINAILSLYDLPYEPNTFDAKNYFAKAIRLEYNPAKLTLKERKDMLKRLRAIANAFAKADDKL